MQNIKFSEVSDVDEIMQFINDHWKENHILSQNKDLFLYEYADNQRINFVISRDSNNKINAILGFIKSSNEIKRYLVCNLESCKDRYKSFVRY